MTSWVSPVADIDELLLDRQIMDADGRPVGKVDDLEFAEQDDGSAPVLSAILCGPMAFGPRLGGPFGLWWLSVARRLRPDADPSPVRISFDQVKSVDRKQIRLTTSGEESQRMRRWTRTKIVARIPGGDA
jgi:sporulation protein YlmC with PRC-barrel domain